MPRYPGSWARPHASDFLADWVQHIPRAKQHQVTHAGWFANALGKLNPKPAKIESVDCPAPKASKQKWVLWRTLILRTWAVDPELCPRCHKLMKRAKALLEQHDLQRLLKNLGIGLYPMRSRSPPPPGHDEDSGQDPDFPDPESQIPPTGTNLQAKFRQIGTSGAPPEQSQGLAW